MLMSLFVYKGIIICVNRHIIKHKRMVPVLKSSLHGGKHSSLCHLIFFAGKYLGRSNKHKLRKINRYLSVMN